MRSSTLPSSATIPSFAVLLLAVAMASLGLSAFYTLRLNPELNYFRGTDRVKTAWADKMTREYGTKLVVYGGSSCEFGIDTERLLRKHQMPAVNLGRGAGMGASILTQAALQHARPGDTLVAAVEQSLFNESLEPPSLGVQFSVATGHPEWVTHPAVGTNSLPWLSVLLNLRPGGYHALTMLGKVAGGKPLFRYQISDVPAQRFQPNTSAPSDRWTSPTYRGAVRGGSQFPWSAARLVPGTPRARGLHLALVVLAAGESAGVISG